MVAINSLEYNKDQPGVYLRYFEMGGMYLCDDGIITDSGNFNGIEKFGDKSRINDCFGEFASHIEGYTENIPVPVCFDIIKNKSGPYGQRASETDCSYRSEAAYIFYINGTIKNFDDFKIILNNEENLKLIKDTIYGVKRRALIRLNDNNRYKNIFYYNAGSGNYTKDLALLPKISIEYNDYKGYPDNPWAQIPQTNSNEQNSQIFGNNFTDAKLKLFSQIQDKNDQLDTITLKLSEDGKKLLKNIDIIKITPKKLTKEEGLSQLDLIKNIEQSGFTKEILENNIITIKRKNVEHFEPLRNFLLKNINKNLVGYNKGYSKEV